MDTRRRPRHPASAHDRFKAHHGRRQCVSLLGSAGLLALVLRFGPAPEMSPDRPTGSSAPEAATPFLTLLPPPLEVVDVVPTAAGPADALEVEEALAFAPVPIPGSGPPVESAPPRPPLRGFDFELLPSVRSTAYFRMMPVPEVPEGMDLHDVVVIKARVSAKGSVVEAYVEKGINRVLDEQALVAAWQLEFPTAGRDAASTWITLPYEFQLR